MKTNQVTFNNVSYGRQGTSSEQVKSLSTRNARLKLDVDFENRVVWVTQEGERPFNYFVPFEACCMVEGNRGDAEAEVILPQLSKAKGPRAKALKPEKAATL